MNKNLSILITSLSGGGAERVVSVLLNELKDEYNITLVLLNDTIAYDIPKEDIEIVYLENSSASEIGIKKILKLPLLGWRYKNICHSCNTDVSLSFMYRPNFINIFAKLFGLKSKVVISERNTPSQVYKGKSLSAKVGNFLIKWLYPKADIIMPNSKGNALDLMKNYNMSEDKLRVIENPFDIKGIAKKGNKEIKLQVDDDFIFIMVGRLEEHKKHMLAVEAFAKLKQSNTQLWILGQGPMQKEIESLIEKFGLENRVKLLGFDKNPYKYMTKADCFLLSSTREGFPNVVVEAMACGLPVISSDCHSGPREIVAPSSDVNKKLIEEIETAEYGMLFPVDNEEMLLKSMETIVKDTNLYKKLQEKSKTRANDFMTDVIIDRFREIL